MGFFSWRTSDTNRSIPNAYSGRDLFTVYMKDNRGNVWQEDAYEGYGVFGGRDFYAVVAEMNEPSITGNDDEDRMVGINIRETSLAPILVEDPDIEWSEELAPRNCRNQGYFYPDYDECCRVCNCDYEESDWNGGNVCECR